MTNAWISGALRRIALLVACLMPFMFVIGGPRWCTRTSWSEPLDRFGTHARGAVLSLDVDGAADLPPVRVWS
jgi:hypothetical protein